MFPLAKNCVGGLVRCTATRRFLTSSVTNRHLSTISSQCSEEENKFTIPVIDMGRLGLDHNPDALDTDWERVAKELSDAFERVGFAYLSGHGVPMTKVDRLQQVGKLFFNLPEEEKMKYKHDVMKIHGYLAFNTESAVSTTYELRESYNLRHDKDLFFPDETVPDFRPAAHNFMDSSRSLAHRLLKVLAVGLDLPWDFFLKNHSFIGQDENRSVGKVAYYPPVTGTLPPNAVRFGAHQDFSTITLVFQDDAGGLQVRNAKGDWIDATPVPGTIVVNVGDMLQLWTTGRFKATEHRVNIPESEVRRRKPRLSTMYFVQPNDSALIQPLDGSNAFEPITAQDHIKKKLLQFY